MANSVATKNAVSAIKMEINNKLTTSKWITFQKKGAHLLILNLIARQIIPDILVHILYYEFAAHLHFFEWILEKFFLPFPQKWPRKNAGAFFLGSQRPEAGLE
jgi:hypothetical protein